MDGKSGIDWDYRDQRSDFCDSDRILLSGDFQKNIVSPWIGHGRHIGDKPLHDAFGGGPVCGTESGFHIGFACDGRAGTAAFIRGGGILQNLFVKVLYKCRSICYNKNMFIAGDHLPAATVKCVVPFSA